MPTQDAILEACKQGDRRAQRAFFDRYKSKMYSLCLRYANNRHDAEDILQEGFLKVFRDLHQYRGNGSLEGWVRKVILRVALQYVKKQQRLFPPTDFSTIEYLLAQEEEEPDHRDLVNQVMHLMQKMPIGFRTVLNLYVMEGYTHPQIAEELGISVGTSKSQLARAKKYLRQLVSQSLTKSGW